MYHHKSAVLLFYWHSNQALECTKCRLLHSLNIGRKGGISLILTSVFGLFFREYFVWISVYLRQSVSTVYTTEK